jgi:hypothetical protein
MDSGMTPANPQASLYVQNQYLRLDYHLYGLGQLFSELYQQNRGHMDPECYKEAGKSFCNKEEHYMSHKGRISALTLPSNPFNLFNITSIISMIRTKSNEFHQILVDDKNYDVLQRSYGANRSFNEVITEILRHHEDAVSIIGECKTCKRKFKEALGK